MTKENALTKKLRTLLELNGPISIADYMTHCLLDPEHGYYTRRDPFGSRGDFITAPDVSQTFGEIVGAWLIEVWRLSGSPSPAHLVELGPGRGTLIADVLRVADVANDFSAAIDVHLVEASAALAARQAETLVGRKAFWHSSFAEVPPGPIFLIANEFFDALPIHQFVRQDREWRERVVGLDLGGRLSFGIGPGRLQNASEAPDGAIVEVRPAGDALIAEIAFRIESASGAALIIDYGYAQRDTGDTLQAVRRHGYADLFEHLGDADLTAHVDFSALAEAAKMSDVRVHGPITQGDFLTGLGLLERAGQLGANADETAREALRAAVERLAGPEQMGQLFKVMAITQPGVVPPPFAV